MKHVILFFLLLSGCTENPFGNSSSSSCEHAPNAQVGLPVVCQVTLSSTTNLALWLDSNEASTVVSSGIGIDSFLDKSGQGNNLSFVSGVKSTINNGSTNQRDALLFDTTSGEYERSSDFNSALPVGSDFSLFIVFRVNSFQNNNILITNNADFSFELNTDGRFEYTIGTGNLQTIHSTTPSELLKVSLIYDASSEIAELYLDGIKINESNFMPAVSQWTEFSITGGMASELMELVIYSDKKVSVGREEVETYLNNKWGF